MSSRSGSTFSDPIVIHPEGVFLVNGIKNCVADLANEVSNIFSATASLFVDFSVWALSGNASIERLESIRKALYHHTNSSDPEIAIRRLIATKVKEPNTYFCFDGFTGVKDVFYVNYIENGLAYFSKASE